MAHIHTAHCHTPAERLAEAEGLCRDRGVRFTDMRRAVYDFLLGEKAPLPAYDILAALQRRLQRPLAPPTVYRALDFLQAQGLLHRLESSNAWLVCDHPQHAHESLYLVCTRCGTAREVDDNSIGQLLHAKAQALGFAPSKQMIEVLGICQTCA